MNDDAVAPTEMRLMLSAAASEGITQLPCVPAAETVNVASAPRGVDRGPTGEAARVSTRRHGTIGRNTNSDAAGAAEANWMPPAPSATTTAAPTADQRALETVMISSSIALCPPIRLDTPVPQSVTGEVVRHNESLVVRRMSRVMLTMSRRDAGQVFRF